MPPKTTKLGTSLTFNVIDMRGRNSFPKGQAGLVYEYLEKRTIKCKFCGVDIKRDTRYAIRTDGTNQGFRIDLLRMAGPAETVYGVTEGRPTYWPSAKDAAAALVGVLDEISVNTSL